MRKFFKRAANAIRMLLGSSMYIIVTDSEFYCLRCGEELSVSGCSKAVCVEQYGASHHLDCGHLVEFSFFAGERVEFTCQQCNELFDCPDICCDLCERTYTNLDEAGQFICHCRE